jgi:hypothetical protein
MSVLTPDLQCRLLDACIISYSIANGTIDPSVQYYADVGIAPGTLTAFVDGEEGINAGFVARTTDDWILLALRGTLPPFTGDFWAWIDDWLNDFQLGPTDWTVDGALFGSVETGFADATISLWNNAEAALAAHEPRSRKGILVTGHSKGGGMAFLAASLVKALYPDVHVEVSTFAAPLTCDRTFGANYAQMGLDTFTVRYQNQYDVVPFLPYYPTFGLLAAAERRSKGGVNTVVTAENWPSIENDYVALGALRYLGDNCVIETGSDGEQAAYRDLWSALDSFDFDAIAEAHSAKGRYHTCVCGTT